MAFHKSFRRNGFTRVELLVVVLVVIVMGALVLMYLSLSTGIGREFDCKVHLKQIATSCLLFEEKHAHLPAGVTSCATEEWRYRSTGKIPCQGPNWITNILEYVDERTLADALDECIVNTCTVCTECPEWTAENIKGLDGHGVGIRTPSIFRCPSAPELIEDDNLDVGEMRHLSKGHYAGCFGADYYKPSTKYMRGVFGVEATPRLVFNDVAPSAKDDFKPAEYEFFSNCTSRAKGLFKNGYKQGVKIVEIKDGPAHTILASETIAVPSPEDGRGAWMWPGMGGAAFTGKNSPNSKVFDGIALCDTNIPEDQITYCTTAEDTKTHAAARSYHPGGVNVAFCNNNVRFISDEVEPFIWQAFTTITGFDSGKEPDTREVGF